MHDDRDIILGKMEEFKSWAKNHFNLLDSRLAFIEKDLHALSLFKNRVYWTVSISSLFIVGVIEWVKTVIELGGK